jgi:hypothetical protein
LLRLRALARRTYSCSSCWAASMVALPTAEQHCMRPSRLFGWQGSCALSACSICLIWNLMGAGVLQQWAALSQPQPAACISIRQASSPDSTLPPALPATCCKSTTSTTPMLYVLANLVLLACCLLFCCLQIEPCRADYPHNW